MNLDTYQTTVRAGLVIKARHDPLAHCAMGLAAEAGEVIDLLKKEQYVYAPPVSERRLIEELGDLTNCCDQLGITLAELADRNIHKLRQRYPLRYPEY